MEIGLNYLIEFPFSEFLHFLLALAWLNVVCTSTYIIISQQKAHSVTLECSKGEPYNHHISE